MAKTVTPTEMGAILRGFRFGDTAARTADAVRPGIVAAMRAAAPYSSNDTGTHLRDTIAATRATTADGSTLTVAATSGHAGFVIGGTKPHNIPRAFGYPWPFGTFGRFGGLFHPGTKANPFNERAWLEVREGVAATFRDTVAAQITAGGL